MSQTWYFRNRGKTWGPFSTPEIKNLAAANLLEPQDLLWPEEGDSRLAVAATAALDFLALDRAAIPAPDWLKDVEEEKPANALPSTLPTPLDWLADIGRWEAAEHPSAEKVRGPGAREPCHGPAQREAASVTPPIACPVDAAGKTTKPKAPVSTDASHISPPTETCRQSPPSAPSNQQALAGRSSQGVMSSTAKARKTVVEAMGFDPQTGQILDPARFKTWKNQQKAVAAASSDTAKSIQEIFQDARRVVEQWVDADGNRDLIMNGDWDTMRQDPNLQESLRPYGGYGAPMMDKLWRHLQFMAENRRKFYSACAKK